MMTVPLSGEEIAHRKEVATEMLASWRAEKPVNSHRSDVKDVSIKRSEDELRYLATIDHLTEQLAEIPHTTELIRDKAAERMVTALEGRLSAANARIADLERQLAERDQQLAESRAMLAQVTRADVPLAERTKG